MRPLNEDISDRRAGIAPRGSKERIGALFAQASEGISMSKHSFKSRGLVQSTVLEQSSRGAKRPVWLTILGCAPPGLLAVLVLVYFLIASRPSPKEASSSPTWSTTTDHILGVEAVAIGPAGQRLATGGNDGSVMLWAVGTGAEKALPGEGSQPVLCLAFSPDGATLAAGNRDASVALWDVASGKKRVTLRGHSGAVRSLAFSPDGTIVATGSEDETIRLWYVVSGDIKDVLPGHRRPVTAVSFAPDGRTLASGCSEGRVKLWDITGAKPHELPGPRIQREPVLGLAFSPDGSILASGGASDGVKLWQVATALAPLTLHTADHATQAVMWSPDGRTLLAASTTGALDRWDVAALRLDTTATAEPGVYCVAFSPDGRFFASGDRDAVVRMWDVVHLLKRVTDQDPYALMQIRDKSWRRGNRRASCGCSARSRY